MAPGVSSCHYREVPPSISFSGSGFLATYQLGVAQCFVHYAPWMLRTAPYVLGASAGSLVAAAVACEISPRIIRDEMLQFAKQLSGFTLGPLNPSVNVFHWLEFVVHKHLPLDAHKLAGGRLAVAMTRMSDRKLIIMSDFKSREDVAQALLCSCYVPGYCGLLPPSFNGVRYLDGGFSSMQPVLPAPYSQILTVSPFSGEMDICPPDTTSALDMVVSGVTIYGNMANSRRVVSALYPMTLQILEEAYDSGYKDAIHFLLSNDLVPYLMIKQISRLDYTQTKGWMPLEEEEEMKVEKEATSLTSSFSDNTCITEKESTAHRPVEEPALQFDMVNNVLLGNALTYLSMFAFPEIIVSHLLLPITLLFCAVLQSRHRLESLFKESPDLVFLVWLSLRNFTLFFFNIIICSFKRNLANRIMPIKLLLLLIKSQAQYETPTCQKIPFSAHSESRHGSLHKPLITPLQDHKTQHM